jgi:hypothetical protein
VSSSGSSTSTTAAVPGSTEEWPTAPPEHQHLTYLQVRGNCWAMHTQQGAQVHRQHSNNTTASVSMDHTLHDDKEAMHQAFHRVPASL